MAFRTTRTDHSKKLILLVVVVAISTILTACRGPAEANLQPVPTVTKGQNSIPTIEITKDLPEGAEELPDAAFPTVSFIVYPSLMDVPANWLVSSNDTQLYAISHGLPRLGPTVNVRAENTADPKNVKKVDFLITGVAPVENMERANFSLLTYQDQNGQTQVVPIIDGVLGSDESGNQSMVARVIKEEVREKFLSTGELNLDQDLGQIVYAINFASGQQMVHVLDEIYHAPTSDAAQQIITEKVHSIAVFDPSHAEHQVVILRNPVEGDHRIRNKPTTESGACRPLNPEDAVHFS